MENSLLHEFFDLFVPKALKDMREAEDRLKKSRKKHKEVSSQQINILEVKDSVEKALREFKKELNNGH